MYIRQNYFYIILLLLLPAAARGQILSSSAEYAGETDYEISGEPDAVFVFAQANTDKYVLAETTSGENATFEWFEYDTLSGAYLALTVDPESNQSSMDIEENIGLMVVISGAGFDDTLRCWAMINELNVNIFNADLEINGDDTTKIIPEVHKWCHLIRDVNAEMSSSTLKYFHPTEDTSYILTNFFTVDWHPNPNPNETGINRIIPNDNEGLKVDIAYPYWEDTWYAVQVTDRYGIEAFDSVFYESIEPHADFTYNYIRLDNEYHYPGRSERYYNEIYGDDYYTDITKQTSAPALFRFDNLSLNADTMLWLFGDETNLRSNEDSVLHTYYHTGSYSPKLVVYNIVPHLYDPCIDTFPKAGELIPEAEEYPIVVDEYTVPAVTLPNIFFIGRGHPDYFRFLGDISITDFEIAIYNRYGSRVHHFNGNIRDWEGWDGNVDNSKRMVPTGVYYYIVKEINTMPDYDTGKKPKFIDDSGSTQSGGSSGGNTGGQDGSTPSSANILKGFVHVYNLE